MQLDIYDISKEKTRECPKLVRTMIRYLAKIKNLCFCNLGKYFFLQALESNNVVLCGFSICLISTVEVQKQKLTDDSNCDGLKVEGLICSNQKHNLSCHDCQIYDSK